MPSIKPGPSADPAFAKEQERNWFFHSLSPAARDRFLDALSMAESRGMDEDAAWREAVIAAETTYQEEDI